ALTPARTHGRVLEGVGRRPARCRDRWLTAARKPVRNRAEHHPLHARRRADAAGDRRALSPNQIGRSRSRRGLRTRMKILPALGSGGEAGEGQRERREVSSEWTNFLSPW